MAYAYEDDEDLTLDSEIEEELDENLNVKKKKEKIELPKTKEQVDFESNKSLEALLASEDNHEYTIDNLLKEEEEENPLAVDNLLTKKDDKLFRAYLGNGYKKITTKQLNYAALLLGPIYLLYRKVYLVGFVWLFLNLFVSFILPLANVHYVIVSVFLLLSYISSGIFSNQIILNNVGTKIVNYKMVEEDYEKLKEKCKKNGGVNIILALIIYVALLALASIVSYKQIMNLYNENFQTSTTNMPMNTERVYFNGQINVDETTDIKNISITVPDDFYLVNDVSYQYYYVYQDPSAYMPKCSIEFDKVKGYKTPDLLISAIAQYHLELEDNIGTRENNYTWKYLNVTDSSKNIYYATTTINNEMYLLKFMYLYQLEDECGSHFEEVLDSINNT